MKQIIYISLGILFVLPANYSFAQKNELAAYQSYFDTELKGWTKSFTVFKLSTFKRTDSPAFEDINFDDTTNIQDFYSVYKPALTFSTDKKQFIDIYSYSMNLEKIGKKIYYGGGDPEQAITLCDLRANKWTRILFCGFNQWIDDAIWVSKTQFILVGARDNDTGKWQPVIYLGDMIQRSFKEFHSTDKNSHQKNREYKSPKLLRLKISPHS